MQKTLAKCESRGAFLFNPKFQKLWLESKWNRPLFLVQFGQNIWQHLWRWSTLDCPTGMTKMTLSIWHKLLSPLLLICTLLKSTYRNTQWLGSGLYNWNVLVYHRQGFWYFAEKKAKFRGIFRGKFAEKSADFAGFSREKNENSLKNRPISRDFRGRKVKIRRKMGRFHGFLPEKSQISKDFQGQILRKIARCHRKFRGETSPRNNQ